jgi:hypothetical protein
VQKNQKYTFQLLFLKDFGFLTRKAVGFFFDRKDVSNLVSHAMKVILNVFEYVLVESNQGNHE